MAKTIPLSDDSGGILGSRRGGIFDPVLTPRVGSLEGKTGDEKTASDRQPKASRIIGKGYTIIQTVRPLVSTLVDLILPPRCFGCGTVTSGHHTLCPDCWKNCTFLYPPCCARCGWPFPHEMTDHALCPSCHRDPPPFIQCRSALAYEEKARGLILKLKQGDGTCLAPGLSRIMAQAGKDILAQTDLLVPIPLHWRRLFWRQYNQATLLARQLTTQTGIPTRVDLIKRHRSTPKQGHQSRKERQKNVHGAFRLRPHATSLLQGKRVTLIDDVLTTGATLGECARILVKGGAQEVRALTLARVV